MQVPRFRSGRRHVVEAPPRADQPFDVCGGAGLREVRSAASVSGVATRVRARTLAYEMAPRAIAALTFGSNASACATRTFSRAAPSAIPGRQWSQ
jgi:hypothetical protein